MYSLFITAAAEKKIRQLPSDIRRDVNRAILALREVPRPRGCRKIIGRENAWRIVVRKDYRVLYTIDDKERRIEIYDVARREKDTYD